MNGKSQGEVILFPKTIDYYQLELTKLLETEAYSEAVRLLSFLESCRTADPRINDEWKMLLHWLKTEFPESAQGQSEAEDGAPDGEEDLLRASVSAKASKDKQYANKLLEMLSYASVDKQLIALDQLAYVGDEGIAEGLKRRLHDAPLHPFVSFKLLQTLAKLGAAGEVTFGKLGEIVTVDIERTPLSPDQFPEPLPSVSDRVHANAETEDPTVSLFAKTTWEEFLSYIYGTSSYLELNGIGETELDIWASALHAVVAHTMYGLDSPEEIQDLYGITEPLLPAWQKCYQALSGYFQARGGFAFELDK